MPDDAPLRFRRAPGREFSTFASWADLSRTIAPLYATAGTIRDSGALAAEVDRIAAATSDPKARADAALRLVQNEIRYLYRGMENGNYVPQAPEEIGRAPVLTPVTHAHLVCRLLLEKK